MYPLNQLIRPNIGAMEAYSSARSEYSGHVARVFLDANENPYNAPYNRYPDPLQTELKAALAKIKGVPADCIFLGNGSDEAIDLCYRCFAEPRRDNVVAIEPTYGMYQVCAAMNDVEYRTVPLDDHYDLHADDILSRCDSHTKLIWLCTPNNPTGNDLNHDEIVRLLEQFQGLVVVDEAYSDFSKVPSMRYELAKYPNIIVLQTMSKAWGSAAIRLGMAFAAKDIIDVFNKVKYPYNVNLLAQEEALRTLAKAQEIDRLVRMIIAERGRMLTAFAELPVCEKVFPTAANFFLAKVENPDGVYRYLVEQGIIVRNRNRVRLCQGCLRVTIGTKSENSELLGALRGYYGE